MKRSNAINSSSNNDRGDLTFSTLEEVAEILRREFSGAAQCVRSSLVPVVATASAVLALLFLDMAYDRAPLRQCVAWIVPVMSAIPVLFYLLLHRKRLFFYFSLVLPSKYENDFT